MNIGLKASLLGLALTGSVLGMSPAQAYTAIGSAFPGFGNDSNGPSFFVSIGSGGAFSITQKTVGYQGPYDGSDDSYVGVTNTSGSTVNSITLSSHNSFYDIFGFDGDGINTYGAPGNSTDTSGYGGPDVSFTVVDAYNGTVNFLNGGLVSGQQTYFSLEENLAGALASPGGITGGVTGGVSPVPLPASLPMFGGALLALGVIAYGSKRRTVGCETA